MTDYNEMMDEKIRNDPSHPLHICDDVGSDYVRCKPTLSSICCDDECAPHEVKMGYGNHKPGITSTGYNPGNVSGKCGSGEAGGGAAGIYCGDIESVCITKERYDQLLEIEKEYNMLPKVKVGDGSFNKIKPDPNGHIYIHFINGDNRVYDNCDEIEWEETDEYDALTFNNNGRCKTIKVFKKDVNLVEVIW